MPSQTTGYAEMRGGCDRFRRFYAFDRSKRVTLGARGAWIAPGRLRFRAYGSPLGPLRASVRLSGKRIDFVNRSRFPVLISFWMDCD